MIIGRVVGNLVSSAKHECYQGKKILLVRPVGQNGELGDKTHVAVDTVGAGIGDTVLLASEGRAAKELLGFTHRMPLRSVITGIIDRIDLEESPDKSADTSGNLV